MCAQLGGGGDGATEEKERVQHVKREHDERVERELLLQRRGDEVEQREQGEHAHEHVVVDDARVAGEGGGDDVAHQRDDEEGPKELEATQLAMELVLAQRTDEWA